jgi:hypothetical protein
MMNYDDSTADICRQFRLLTFGQEFGQKEAFKTG